MGKKRKGRKWDLSPNISMTTLNVNDLNTPIQMTRLTEWIKKEDSTRVGPCIIYYILLYPYNKVS